MSDLSFVLPAQLRISDVEALYTNMSELDLDTESVSIDAGAVEKIDFCGLQLVLAFVGRLTREGVRVCWTGVSEVFDNAAKESQLQGKLGLNIS